MNSQRAATDDTESTYADQVLASIASGQRVQPRAAVRCVGYIRVSTEEQANSGLSLEAQKHTISHECDRRGWSLSRFAIERASTRKLRKRTELLSVFEELDAGAHDVLMVTRLDRLSRGVGEFAAFMERAEKRGWTIVVLDPAVDMTTPFGRAMAGMASVFAQLERDLISQRTKEALRAKIASGEWTPPQTPYAERTFEVLRELAAQPRDDGRPRSSREISAMLRAGYGITMAPRTVRKHLERLRRDDCAAA